MNKNTALVTLVMLLTAGCSQSVSDYRNETPQLRLDQFFRGESRAWGVLQDWRGRQTVRFTAQLCGVWQEQKGDLYEVFHFSDGRVEQRHWQLQQAADGSISGTAGDVVGMATGQLAGNSLYWQYSLVIPYDDSTLQVDVEDWLYLIDAENLLNRTTLYKFGVPVAELTLSIQQQDINADCTALQQQVKQLSE